MKISLITVTYNSGATLRDTIESVLGQTYKNVEYIIVDGKSKDNTVQIIQEYEPRFNGNMKWISEKDSGLYDAMNKGIMMATGDVIGILNSDDFFTSNDVLESVATTFLSNTSIDAVYGDIHFVDPNNTSKITRIYSSKNFSPNKMKLGLMPPHPSFYCQRKYFQIFGLYKTDYIISADFELLLRFIYLHKLNIQYIDKDMVTMRQGGISTKNNLKDRLLTLNERKRCFKENNLKYSTLLLCLGYVVKLTGYIR